MRPSLLDSDEEDLGEYQKELRERANRSIQQLSRVLAERSSEAESMEPDRSQDSDSTAGEDSWNHVRQSDAANQLRSLLRKGQRETPPHSPSKRKSHPQKTPPKPDASLPQAQDLVPMIHNQSEYIQHLEAEVKFCKEELVGMKQRIRVVVMENEKLHEELKSRTVEDTLKDYTILDTTVALCAGNVPESVPMGRSSRRPPASGMFHSQHSAQAEDHSWQNEMDKLKTLYQSQTETLEAQVISLRKDLAMAQKECEEVKGRVRRREAVAAQGGTPRAGGLCLKCAQHEAVLAQTHTNVHVQAIERLTKERDELMSVLASLRASQSDAQHREWSAYQQVKQAVQMAEEANLEKTQALVQCEQMRSELGRQRERLEKEAAEQQEKIAQAREGGRGEARKEKEELAQTVALLSQKVAELEGQLDRGERERRSLQGQLEEALDKLRSQEADSSKVCAELRYQLSQAQLKKEEAERGLRDHASKSSRQQELAQQEAERLGLELNMCRQRLEEAQRDASRAQAEALGLTERLGQAQHQLHLTRQEKEAGERAAEEGAAAAAREAERRERELAQRLQEAEHRHERTVGEMDALLSSQNSLISKLREECSGLGAQLEAVMESSRSELQQLCLERQHLQESVQKLRSRCQEMEEQCVQHGKMHQRMKNRLQQLDQHCQASAQQVMELLDTQNRLMQERHALSEEMQKLRVQVGPCVRCDNKLKVRGCSLCFI
ncbi:serologically defined colon cancer antigen 8 homolog isoform X2 [Megalops cyprinoides]|uniref:serologically defined colon cancer antigen 8 homolog isoform X2 n=1 Tax=Megalops cyprinoides TaxID=118141 RepID=UPI001864FEA6|nr:serologically defined colon cancer antigen 8 homolog isoform X2 [Megalops cyprinoides]